MTLSRWRRVATGIAAGVIVLCAALLGASFRDDGGGVSVASEVRPTNVIPIEEDPGADDDADDSEASDSVQVIETDALPDDDEDEVADATETPADTSTESSDDAATADDSDSADENAADSAAPDDATADSTATDEAATDSAATDDATADSADTDDTAANDDAAEPAEAAEPAQTEPETPAAPITAADDALGTGGGVDDAECALDRLVIYAGARRGGVAGSIRAALAQAGFGAGCPTPVTVLASNCPQQFAGVLGAGSGYDPLKSYVAASDSVDRETMTAIMGSVGYSGNAIDILDFGFVNPDRPGEQWIAIFVPPSFTGWENLAARAGLSPTTNSLCAPSGELAG